ncbi:MAG: biopolymer transporter ExbD [Puniceicoccales bacterium]|jgi:biopolymer transport protein ExbD/biopolymer transport protein TolR|nr:biopolymer transporter ExbD [Puniceicoccales bacterium]
MNRQRRFNNTRTRPLSALTEINVTPLLDMCFCLLIIFMIATPVMEQTTQIDLPVASAAVASPATKKTVKVVALDRDGNLSYAGRAVTEDALRVALRAIATASPESQPIIHIRADGSLTNQRTWDLFSLVKESGVSSVGIDTELRN